MGLTVGSLGEKGGVFLKIPDSEIHQPTQQRDLSMPCQISTETLQGDRGREGAGFGGGGGEREVFPKPANFYVSYLNSHHQEGC